MALINCPECNKEVSDKSINCIHCGCPLNQNSGEEKQTQQVEITSLNIKGKNLKKSLVSVGIIVVVIIAGLFIFNSLQSKAEEAKLIQEQKAAEEKLILETNEYIDNLVLARATMFEGGAEAESVANLMRSIWYNTIYEEAAPNTDKYTHIGGDSKYFYDDFNDALYSYQSSDEFTDSITLIEANQVLVQAIMKKLQTPPTGLETVYQTITDLHDAYLSVCKNATSPSGNLSSFTESVTSSIDGFIILNDKLETQIPDKK